MFQKIIKYEIASHASPRVQVKNFKNLKLKIVYVPEKDKV